MTRSRNVVIGSMLVALLAALAVGQHLLQQTAEAQAKGGAQAPTSWPLTSHLQFSASPAGALPSCAFIAA